MNNKLIFLIFLPLLLLIPSSTFAATLYLDPVLGKLGPQDAVEVKVKIGVADGECINAANIVLNFPSDVLEVKDFISGDSLFSLWVDRPNDEKIKEANEKGIISFSGGLPGGYCGRVSGDPGDSNVLGAIVVSLKKPIVFSKAGMDFSSNTEVFLNDGNGTFANISTQGMNFEISSKASGQPKDDWGRRIREDKIPPETFVIEISKDDRISDGRYFIVFSTTDKQTGIDHYEVLENKKDDATSWLDNLVGVLRRALNKQEKESSFEVAQSPHILKDQNLKSQIKVKAVDRAGNERVVEYHNKSKSVATASGKISWPVIALALLVFGVLMSVFAVFKRIRKG